MADQKDTYGYVSKTTGGFAHAADLVIVGLDCDADVRPELHDAQRIKAPPSAQLIQSIKDNGIVQPVGIKTYRGDDHVYVADGRQRVMAARIANEGRNGDEEILVPCYVVKDAVTTFVAANRGRKQNSLIADVLTAAHLRSCGHEDHEIARMFSIGISTLKSLWWVLADASPAIRKAIETTAITATVGAEIAKMPAQQQADALKTAIEDGRGGATLENVRAARKASSNGGTASDAPRRLSLGVQKKFADALVNHISPEPEEPVPEPVQIASAIFALIHHGDVTALEPWPALQHAFTVATAPKGEEA